MPGPPQYALPKDEAHIWFLDPAAGDWDLLSAGVGALSGEELARSSRLRFEPHRRTYLAAHLLLRSALSACVPQVSPERWNLVLGSHGRPQLADPGIDLNFNLSHTDGMVACIVVRRADCGIDVEAVIPDIEELIEEVLDQSERQWLSTAAPAARPALFSRLWTLKEAYVKARGLGLSLPPSQCVFSLDGDTATMIMEPDGRQPEGWQFYELAPAAGYRLSVALRLQNRSPFRVVRHVGTPDARLATP